MLVGLLVVVRHGSMVGVKNSGGKSSIKGERGLSNLGVGISIDLSAATLTTHRSGPWHARAA